MRAIDADTAIKMISYEMITDARALNIFRNLGDIDKVETLNMACERHIRMIEQLPTVDVAPVKQGHWVHKYDSWTCSECYYTFHGKPLWKYCPHCGAKNEVEDGNDN